MATSKARGVGVCLIGGGVMICSWLLALQGCAGGDVTAPEPQLVWSGVPSGTADDLWDVWGSSATDVWAVGYNGTIVHYDGTRWARSLDSVSYFFRGVWGSGPTDIWAVGIHSLNNPAPVIFHYDGKGWARDASFADTLPSLSDVWGTSASNVWAVGYGGWISHFDGSRWTNASVGPAFFSSDRIWGTSATDAWTVGPQTVLHYDGIGWYSQSDSVLTARQLSAGWGARQNDQWAAGFARAFLHFDGSSWSPVVPEDTASGFINGMWGVTPSRIWAVSRTGTSGPGVGAIWQYNGTQWFIVARDTVNLTGVWASSGSDAWVVGDFGTVLHGTLAR